jgi:hypothetical protein
MELSNGKANGVLRKVGSYDTLEEAYHNIIGGSINSRVKAQLSKLGSDIISGRYKAKPKMIVPLEGNSILGVPSIIDNIVQEGVRIVLETLYEPTFSNLSHSFRPYRSCHTALRNVKYHYHGVRWFIEGSIKLSYNSLEHHKIIDLLGQRISDKGFFDLIWKLLRAGYGASNKTQVNILEAILTNILLDSLDKWVEAKIEYVKIHHPKRRANPVYTKILYQDKSSLRAIREGIRPHIMNDPNFMRIMYTRFANFFLFGIIGSKQFCRKFSNEIKEFIKITLGLELNEGQTIISHAADNGAFFLGVNIRNIPDSGKQVKVIRRASGDKLFRIGHRPQLLVPTLYILKQLASLGMVKSGKWSPTGVTKWTSNKDEHIVKLFAYKYLSLLAYYKICDNRALLAKIHYLLHMSCGLTLARKHGLSTVKKAFDRFGYPVAIRGEGEVLVKFPKYSLPEVKWSKTLNLNPYKF